MGLLVAVVAMPPAQDILIRLDNQDVVTRYQSLVANRNKVLPRKRQRASQAGLWSIFASVVKSRTGSTAVEWIRGHDNNIGNELADEAATDAVQQDTAPWYVDLHAQTDIPYIAHCHGQQLEVDLRQFLK